MTEQVPFLPKMFDILTIINPQRIKQKGIITKRHIRRPG